MNYLLRTISILAIGCVCVSASGQDAFITGHQRIGHEVDSSYLHFDGIRREGDPQGVFAYAKRHVRAMTEFEHGEPVFVLGTREVPPDDVTLVRVRRVGESTAYWTDPNAISKTDPLADQKAKQKASRAEAARVRLAKAKVQSELQREVIERLREQAKRARPPRRPVAIERYWQIDHERFRGKLVNANEALVKIHKSDGETIIVDRTHLSEDSDEYVGQMLHDLELYREYQRLMASS